MEQSERTNEVIETVSEKFGYDEELKNVLRRIIPIMIEGKSPEIAEMLYKTLERTKIFILDEMRDKDQYNKCKQEILGDVNQDVEFVEEDMGEYSNTEITGGYVTEPVFDENMNIVDRRSFICISRLYSHEKIAEMYGTNINLSHLIHELGHAWASEKEEFIQKEDGTFVMNVGAISSSYEVDRERRKVIPLGTKGLYQEETLNSVEEENILCKLLGLDDMTELFSNGYIKSNYQWFMTDIMREYVEKFGTTAFDSFRYLKDRSALINIEATLKQTESWGTLSTPKYTEKKKEKFEKISELQVPEGAKNLIMNIVEKYRDVFFADNTNLSPMDKLNNVFEQIFSIGKVKYNFGALENEANNDIYKLVISSIIAEGFVPIREVEFVKEEKQNEENNFISGLKGAVKTPEETARSSNEEDKPEVRKRANIIRE